MKLFPDIKKIPDTIAINTEAGKTFSFSGTEKKRTDDVLLTFSDGNVTLKADTTPISEIILRWNFPMPDDTLFCGDHWERGYGDLEWRGYVPERPMPWYFYALCGKVFAGFGVETKPDAFCHFKTDKGGVSLFIDVRSGGRACILSGKEITCCKLICDEYENEELFECEKRFTAKLCSDSLFPDKPIYGFNNWYYAYGDSSADEILENTAHVARLTKGLENRPFMVIDDGWQEHRLDEDGFIGGSWRMGNAKFPDMKKLAEEMTAYDVLPGIWCRPTQNKSEDIPEEWYLNKDEFILDISVPEVLSYIAKDIDTICEWGYKLIKYDYSTYDLTGKWGKDMWDRVCSGNICFKDRSKTTAMLIKELYKTVYDAAGGRAIILGCNTIGHLGTGYMHLNRTGDDTSGREWSRTRKMGVNTLAFRMAQHNNFYFVDADCAGLTKDVPWEKNKQWLELLAKSGTPLFVSVAPDTLDDEQNAFLGQMLAYASTEHPTATPLGMTNDVTPQNWMIEGEEKQFNWY